MTVRNIIGGTKAKLLEYLQNEDGMGTVEVILIIVVLIGLVIIFKSQITALVQSIFGAITEKSGVVTG